MDHHRALRRRLAFAVPGLRPAAAVVDLAAEDAPERAPLADPSAEHQPAAPGTALPAAKDLVLDSPRG